MRTEDARAIVRQALSDSIERVLEQLQNLDEIIAFLNLKGTQIDLNLRTAAIALNVAANAA